MTFRAVGAAVSLLLALAPLTAAAASPPDPRTLRASLADPVDSGFVEAAAGTEGTLEGPFDAAAYGNYWRGEGVSEQEVQSLLQHLAQDKFAGGYARYWYLPGAAQVMGELVLVFQSPTGALGSEAASKVRYAEDAGFQSFLDPGVGHNSFAATLSSAGYKWTVAVFVKGDALYAVSRGSATDFMTTGALAQTQRAYQQAPATIALAAPAAPVPPGAQWLRLALIVGGVAALVAVAVWALVAVLVTPGRQSVGISAEAPRP